MLDNIAKTFAEQEGVRDTEVSGDSIRVNLAVNDIAYTLVVNLKKPFPKALPTITLETAAQYGFIPHICWRGIVCYNDGEGLSIDYSNPTGIALYALEKAVSLLPSSKDVSLEDFYNEFEGYWNQQDNIASCHLFFESENELKEIWVREGKPGKPVCIVDSRPKATIGEKSAFFRQLANNTTELRGYYLPLEESVAPPLPGQKIPLQFMDQIFAALSEENTQRWNNINHTKLPKRLTLLISQPRPYGGLAVFGITLPANAFKAWENGQTYNKPIIPVAIHRHTGEFLSQRGGGNIACSDKKLAIVGCGALGCRIAELCLASGIRNITLADDDEFSQDNIYRHILDSRFIQRNKANALKDYFVERFPDISVTAIPKKIGDLSELLQSVDVIVVAIGNPTIERTFDSQQRSYKSENCAALVTTWLEAAGTGGHVVISDGKSAGCLHCLYHRDNSFQLSSITSLVAPGQTVTKNLTGCGGAFVPYGAVHATKTATITVECILSHFAKSQNTAKTKYRYWSSDEQSPDTNLKMSDWYYDSLKAGSESAINQVFENGCPCCR